MTSTKWTVLGACVLTLAFSFAIKARCLGGFEDLTGYRDLCVSDLREIYGTRTMFPYINGPPSYVEYPVLTGLFIWIVGVLASSADANFLIASAVFAVLALVSAFLLADLAERRALLFALAPALVFYAFAGWDLLALAATVVALWCFHRESYRASAVWLAVGASAKFFPALMLPALVLYLWRSDRREAIRVGLVGAGTLAALNLPIALLSPEGFWHTFTFHRIREANMDSFWAFIWPGASPGDLNLVTSLVIVLGSAVVLLAAYRYRYGFVATSGSLLCVFMIGNKIQSTGWTLWLLPFFALLSVHWLWWFAYAAADFLVYVGIYRFFYSGMDMDRLMWTTGVWARSFLLICLIVVFLRSTSPSPLAGRLSARAYP